MENIIENVLKDSREGDGQFTSRLENVHGWSDYNKRYGIYQNFKKNEGKSSPDADHWKRALDSYMSYPCFSGNQNYYWNKDSIIYDDGQHYVKISADILTNPGSVLDWIDLNNGLLNTDEQNIINAFLKVSYTIGNFCPIWKNGGSGGRGKKRSRGNDNIWYKLDKGGFEKKIGIESREDPYNNLNRRKVEDLFQILPSDKEDVIKELFFIDYYENESLRWNKGFFIPQMDKETFVEFVQLTTELIVYRGYRIVNKIKEEELKFDDLNNLLQEIGLEEPVITKKRF